MMYAVLLITPWLGYNEDNRSYPHVEFPCVIPKSVDNTMITESHISL